MSRGGGSTPSRDRSSTSLPQRDKPSRSAASSIWIMPVAGGLRGRPTSSRIASATCRQASLRKLSSRRRPVRMVTAPGQAAFIGFPPMRQRLCVLNHSTVIGPGRDTARTEPAGGRSVTRGLPHAECGDGKTFEPPRQNTAHVVAFDIAVHVERQLARYLLPSARRGVWSQEQCVGQHRSARPVRAARAS